MTTLQELSELLKKIEMTEEAFWNLVEANNGNVSIVITTLKMIEVSKRMKI